ncbi:MAG: kelch repeat-containing protein [Chthoniobacterales bacterium]
MNSIYTTFPVSPVPTSRRFTRSFVRGAVPLLTCILAATALAVAITFQWSPTESPGTERFRQSGTTLNDGRVLITGGYAPAFGVGVYKRTELYDPATESWSSSGDLNEGRYFHTATLLRDGRVLIAGGFGYQNNSFVPVASAELYDPATGTFTPTGSMTKARSVLQATRLRDGRVLVIAGDGATSAEIYDPATGTWAATGALNESRSFASTALLRDGKVLVAGGQMPDSPYARATAELYDPGTGTWSFTGTLSVGRTNHTANLLRNGSVLVAGGGELHTLSSCELYNPTSGTWTPTGSMHAARFLHRANLIANSQVLVTGGAGDQGLTSATEIYNPRTGAWTTSGDLNTPRDEHTANVLPDGRVLVTGGMRAERSAELGTGIR